MDAPGEPEKLTKMFRWRSNVLRNTHDTDHIAQFKLDTVPVDDVLSTLTVEFNADQITNHKRILHCKIKKRRADTYHLPQVTG